MSVENFLKGVAFGRDNYFTNQENAQKLTETRIGQQLLNQAYSDQMFLKPSELMKKLSLNKYQKSAYDTGKKSLDLDREILNLSAQDYINSGINQNKHNALNNQLILQGLEQTYANQLNQKRANEQTNLYNAYSNNHQSKLNEMATGAILNYNQRNPQLINDDARHRTNTLYNNNEAIAIASDENARKARLDQAKTTARDLLAQGNSIAEIEQMTKQYGTPIEQWGVEELKKEINQAEYQKKNDILAQQKTSQAYALVFSPFELAKQQGIKPIDENGNPLNKEALQEILMESLGLAPYIKPALDIEHLKSKIYKNYQASSTLPIGVNNG